METLKNICEHFVEKKGKNTLPNKVSDKVLFFRERYKSRDNFLLQFNPSCQPNVYNNREEAFLGNYPTLLELQVAFTKNTPIIWIVAQLFNLSSYCGCKDKLSESQLEECARVILSFFGYLKVTELMIFFYKFKAGDFGKFYGAIDPIVITSAIKEFMSYRSNIFMIEENRINAKKIEDAKKNAISYEEYKKLKENGKI